MDCAQDRLHVHLRAARRGRRRHQRNRRGSPFERGDPRLERVQIGLEGAQQAVKMLNASRGKSGRVVLVISLITHCVQVVHCHRTLSGGGVGSRTKTAARSEARGSILLTGDVRQARIIELVKVDVAMEQRCLRVDRVNDHRSCAELSAAVHKATERVERVGLSERPTASRRARNRVTHPTMHPRRSTLVGDRTRRKRVVADHAGSAVPTPVSDRSRCAQLALRQGSWRRTRRRVRRGAWWSRAGRSREG